MRLRDGLESAPACATGATAGAAGAGALPYAEQLSRNVRARLLAAATVLLVHSAYPPGHAVLATVPPHVAAAEALAFRVLVSFPVDVFILLAFLGLAPRLRGGAGAWDLARTSSRRLLPAHLFWASVFLLARAAAQRQLPTPAAVVEGVVLGRAASHLYFIPQLLALTLAAPILDRCARSARAAASACAGLALASVVLEKAFGTSSPWLHAAIGFLGLAPFAVAGLAFARRWQGTAPDAHRALGLATWAGPALVASVALLARASLEAPLAPVTLTAPEWLGNFGCAMAVPLLLLAVRVPRRSSWQIRIVPYTLGVYLVHPLFVQGLRAAEAHVAPLRVHPFALVLPNALLAAGLSVAAVAALARTPLRRFVI